MKLSIITLTYNKLAYTKKYIESLYKNTSDFELIVVDNGSTDGTTDYLRSLNYKNIKIVLNDVNKGFSAGTNQGIELAEGEFIGFLNNDILLCPNWFEALEKVFICENAAFVSPREISSLLYATNDKKYLSYFKKRMRFGKEYEKSFEDCTFSCVVTKKEVISQIGNFDENYSPAFFEDNDYKYRAIEAGYDVYVCNAVCYYHYGSVTSKSFNQNFEKNRQYYYSKNRFGEYLKIYSEKSEESTKIARDFKKFPLKQIYELWRIPRRIRNRIIMGPKVK